MEFAFDATFFAFVGLVLFLALVVYLKVPGMMARSLDDRADQIRNELAEAKRLREEASTCSPNTSASARKPKPKRPTSLPPPSAKPKC